MTIRKGEPWGTTAPLPDGAPVASTDAEAAAALLAARSAGSGHVIVGLVGGDLHRTLGSPSGGVDRLRGPDAMTFPIDLLDVTTDQGSFVAIAHVVARRGWWTSRTVVAMNAAFVGDMNLGPRSHPDDGLVDVTDGHLPVLDAFRARSRSRSGAHLPHPDLAVRRVAAFETTFERPTPIRVDGRPTGRSRLLRVEIVPDAAWVVA